MYPPVAFAEIYRNDASTKTKIRRLHLLVVDLERTKSVSDQVYWQYQKVNVSADYAECFNTLPVPIADAESPVRCRYVYGYGVDGSDRPSYLLWPRRGSDGHFWLMDPRSGEFFDPAKATFIASLGLKHFFDAFALEHKRDVRVDAAFFFSNAALLKTVAVMFLQTLGQKEAGNYSPVPQNKTRQAPTKAKTKQHTGQGSGCSKRDVKRVAKYDVRQPANSLFKSPHTLRCSLPENTITKIITPDPAQLSTNNSQLRAIFIIKDTNH